MFDKSIVKSDLVSMVQEMVKNHNNSIRRINEGACEMMCKFLGVSEPSEIVGAFYETESLCEKEGVPFINFRGIDESDMRLFVELTLTCERD